MSDTSGFRAGRGAGSRRLGRALFRAATWSFPPAFRGAHGAEMEAAFATELERREAHVAALTYSVRAAWDATRQGLRERVRRGVPSGHGGRNDESREEGMMDGLWMDVRLGLRSLKQAPGFALAAVLVLALGIGANTTVFSALEMAVLSPPPFQEPERLVLVDLTMERAGEGGPEIFPWSYPKFQTYLASPNRLVEAVAGYASRSGTLTEAGDPVRLNVELVSPGYFSLLGLEPVRGRSFTADEGDADSPPLVAVLGHELWFERFGGDPGLLGRDIVLNGRRLQVVGIAPEGVDGLSGGSDLWVPMAAAAVVFNRFMITGAEAHWFHVVGRLAERATFEEALAQTASVGDGIDEAFPSSDARETYSASLRALGEVWVNEDARASVWVMGAAALLVLLVACANLSGLLLARARRRSRDGAVRVAVGASRWRLIRASLVESLVLAVLGGSFGVVVSLWGTRAMASSWPQRFLGSVGHELRVMRLDDLTVDTVVLGFALGATLVTTVLFGLLPALRSARTDASTFLKDGSGATRRGGRLLGLDGRSALVGAQLALALVLVVGAGLMASSTLRLLEVDEGFRTENLITFDYAIPTSNSMAATPDVFHAEFTARVEALPGVESATVGCAPLRGHCWITRVDDIEGDERTEQGEGPPIGIRMVGDRHFEKLGIPLLRGRTLDERDGTDRAQTVVISKLAAEELFPGADPLGRRIRVGVSSAERDPYAEIVGVVGDVLYTTPDQDMLPEAYFSFREFPDRGGSMTVRTSGDPLAAVPAIRAAMTELDPTVAVYSVITMDALVTRSVGDRRVILGLLGIFACVALLLAAVGTWGVVSYSVADRRRELGLRMALGAGQHRVLRMVMGQSVRIALIGVILGLAGAAFGARVLETFLWDTAPRDPLTFAAAAALLTTVVLVASYLPARRATRVDPVEAIRAE